MDYMEISYFKKDFAVFCLILNKSQIQNYRDSGQNFNIYISKVLKNTEYFDIY